MAGASTTLIGWLLGLEHPERAVKLHVDSLQRRGLLERCGGPQSRDPHFNFDVEGMREFYRAQMSPPFEY